jgi:hypothetical protein
LVFSKFVLKAGALRAEDYSFFGIVIESQGA